MSTELGVSIAFWILAAITVGAGIWLVSTRNVFHAALALIAAFMGFGGLYATLSADFMAVVQILVYAGAVAIVMVFAIMMTAQQREDPGRFQLPAAIMGVVLVVIVAVSVLGTAWPISTALPAENTPPILAEQLLGPYILPFEIVSVLLVAAMVGAIIIARER